MVKVPQIVKNAAKDLIEIYGDKFDYLGKYEGRMLMYINSLREFVRDFHSSILLRMIR